MTKPASRDRPSERGDGASPLPTPRSSHFGAACGERDGSSPLADDMRCPHGTDQGGTVEVLPPLTCVRGGFSALEKRGYTGVLSASPISAPVPPGWHPDFFRFRGEIPFVSGDPQPERVFAHSRSGRDPVPAADGSGAGDGTAGSVGSMGAHSLLGGTAAGADGGSLLEGNRPVLSGFLSGAPVDCRGVRTSEPGRHLLGLLAPASGEQQLGRGQGTGGAAGTAGQGTAGSAPEDRHGGPAAAGRGGADGSHHAGDWKITGGIAFIYHILLRIKRYF